MPSFLARSLANPLTHRGFNGFIKRRLELSVHKSRKLDQSRAESSGRKQVYDYFTELARIMLKYNLLNRPNGKQVYDYLTGQEKIMLKYNLIDRPNLTFNMDEKGVIEDHLPPFFHPYCNPWG